MLEILNNYPWTRLSVRIIGAIKRQFFHLATHMFDNSNLSQKIFAIDTWGGVIYSLGHGRQHMRTTICRLGLIQWYAIKTSFCMTISSTADTCKNCAKCGKGFKIGTNEAYNIKIKIKLGGISKIFCFCSHANMAA